MMTHWVVDMKLYFNKWVACFWRGFTVHIFMHWEFLAIVSGTTYANLRDSVVWREFTVNFMHWGFLAILPKLAYETSGVS